MKPDADNRKRKSIPAHVPPAPERVCIPVRVPDDPEYIALFMGALFELTKQSRFDRDPTHLARLVAQVWTEIYHQTAESVRLGETCDSLGIPDDGCTEYMPNHPMFAYAPNDPFQTPLLIPSGYLLPSWYVNPLIPLPGVQPTDAMVNFLSIPATATLPELVAAGFPRVRIPFQGTGEIEIELVRIPQGGIAIIQLDSSWEQVKVVDLNSVALIGLPSVEDILDVILEDKIAETEIIEMHVTTGGAHYIDIIFLPNIGAEILLGFGGGLRRVSYCADAAPGDVPVPEFRITDCDLEWRPNNLAVWSNLGNVCGDDGDDGAPGANGSNGADAQWPVGVFVPFGGTVVPTGWLLCNGAAISRTTYAELFAVMGTNFGAGNGTTTFNIPDMRQRYPRGIGAGQGEGMGHTFGMGDTGGADDYTLGLANLPDHTHGAKRRTNSGAGNSPQLMAANNSGVSDPDVTLGVTGVSSPHSPIPTIPRTLAANYIVCAQSVHSNLNVEFRVVDCQLQWRKAAADAFVNVPGGDLTLCAPSGLDGQTPEIRLVTVDADTKALEWKYTNEPEVPGIWRTAGLIDLPTGLEGDDGRTPQIRLISLGTNFYALQWKYTDDPDLSALWRTAGTFHTGGIDNPSPSPIETAHDNACGMAYLITADMTALLNDLMEVWDGSISIADAFANAVGLLTDAVGFGFIITGVITQLESIASVGTAVIREALIASDIEAATQSLFCDFVVYGYSFNVLRTWAQNIYNDPSSSVGMKTWAFMLFVLNEEYWNARAYLGSLTPSNLCELNPCDDFDQPLTGVEFFTASGSTFEQDPTYTAEIVIRWPGGGLLGETVRVNLISEDLSAINGKDYEFTPTFVTFPATVASGARLPVSLTIYNNGLSDGTRHFRLAIDSIETARDNTNIGIRAKHDVVIYDNETLALVIADGRGANLHLVDSWLYEVDAVAEGGTSWAIRVRSAVDDANNCWKLKQIAIMIGGVTSYVHFGCGSSSGNAGLPTVNQVLHRLHLQGNGFFRVRLLIEPE